jgi:hypothetical protein
VRVHLAVCVCACACVPVQAALLSALSKCMCVCVCVCAVVWQWCVCVCVCVCDYPAHDLLNLPMVCPCEQHRYQLSQRDIPTSVCCVLSICSNVVLCDAVCGTFGMLLGAVLALYDAFLVLFDTPMTLW